MSGNVQVRRIGRRTANPPVINRVIAQLPRRTLLQKAREDLLRCQQEVDGELRWCKRSRKAMVDLLSQAIVVAQEKNYDDELYLTYRNISVLINGWYFEDLLKNIIRTTLLEIQSGVLERQIAEQGQLSAENQRLRQAFDALDRANRILEQTVEEKSALLRSTQASLANVQQENKTLRQDLEKERAANTQLREELARTTQLPSPARSAHFRDFKANSLRPTRYAGPRLFTGSPRGSVTRS